MTKQISTNLDNLISDGLIVFISGVQGMGKTTVSYELLKNFSEFRIVEETDIAREILRGYNNYLKTEFGNKIDFVFDKICITDHTKLLTFEEAKSQCEIMLPSFEQIVARQQRKGIATIINGVHIIPEVMDNLVNTNSTIFINLYITDEHEIYKRIYNRDSTSYMLNYIPFIFQTNNALYSSTERIAAKYSNVFNINVTGMNVDDTIQKILDCIKETMKKSL